MQPTCWPPSPLLIQSNKNVASYSQLQARDPAICLTACWWNPVIAVWLAGRTEIALVWHVYYNMLHISAVVAVRVGLLAHVYHANSFAALWLSGFFGPPCMSTVGRRFGWAASHMSSAGRRGSWPKFKRRYPSAGSGELRAGSVVLAELFSGQWL